jgi:cytochrome c-type biogenesis protein CcsB
MKIFVSLFFSMFFTGILVTIFAVSIGYATFIENDYGTITAKILIYNAGWFEFLLLIMSINLIGSIFVNKLIQQKRWPGFLIHISFVVIFAGAALTRYVGYEGTMHIRENAASSTIISEPVFIKVLAKTGSETVVHEKRVMFSPYTTNNYSSKLNSGGKQIRIKNIGFVPSAEDVLEADPAGSPLIAMIVVENETRRTDFLLQPGETKKYGTLELGFDKPVNNGVRMFMQNGVLFAQSTDTITVLAMMGEQPEVIAPDSVFEISTQKAYSSGDVSFAIKQYLSKGIAKLRYVQNNEGNLKDAIQAEVTVGNTTRTINVFGAKGEVGEPVTTEIDGVEIAISYGSKIIEIPFSIYLKDFQLERYPGSNSPSSYASEVVLKDGATEKPFRIFMNNILKYKGYRFFQSSFDHDEQGTILSVNHDALGTTVTYIGYLIMAIGMVFIFFNKNSRIKTLIKNSGKLRAKRKKLFAVLIVGVFLGLNASAQNAEYNSKQVSDFSKLLIQTQKGRIEPVNTIASEIVRKVTKKNAWKGITPAEMFLDMQVNPSKWQNEPIIKIANPELRRMLNISGSHTSFRSMFDASGNYRLGALVTAAYEKKPNQRNKLDKEIMNVDERVNILMEVFTGNFLTIFPVPGDDNHKWIALKDVAMLGTEGETFARNSLTGYLTAVQKEDWVAATGLLNRLIQYQQTEGAKIIPPAAKINFEVLYINLNIFGKLSNIFMFLGLLMLVINLITIFKPEVGIANIRKITLGLVVILFIFQTAGLGIRWYISGHAPWSNGYESMVFISWATCLAGILFARRSEITLSMTTLLAGLTLMVAGMSWMSPEITPLVPVLKSYWLIVHVAIITSSYGFLGVGALLGAMNLILMILRNKNNTVRIELTIKELVNIIDITLIIGLIMVTLGSFLGGVWANESWGRYWGWDPKETWALVTVLVYTFISHMHKIPGFKGNFAMSTAALVGFGSVLMTYFGVNYYLSGLHSYAQGEPAPVPTGVYVALAVVFVLIVAAFFADKQNMEQTKLKVKN